MDRQRGRQHPKADRNAGIDRRIRHIIHIRPGDFSEDEKEKK